MDTAFLKLLVLVVVAGCVGVTLVSLFSPLGRLHRRPREAVVVVIAGTMGSGLGGEILGAGALHGLAFGVAYSIPVALVPPVIRWCRVGRKGDEQQRA